MMLPAPRKPTPVITPWIIRGGARLGPPMSCTACFVTSTTMVDPRHTSVWVRRPAGLRPSWRSQPTSVPSTVEISMAIRSCTRTPLPRRRDWAPSGAGLLAPEARRALLEEGLEPLVHVLARRQDAEESALEPEPRLERELEPAPHRLQGRGDGERSVLQDRLGQPQGLSQQLLAGDDAVPEPAAPGPPSLAERLAVERVQDIGAVDEQHRDGAAALDLEVLVGLGGRWAHECLVRVVAAAGVTRSPRPARGTAV